MQKSESAPIDPKILEKLRRICLELPEATEKPSWGKPHFSVAGKIFCGCRNEAGRTVIGLLLEMGHAQKVIEDPRFWLVGNKGGVCMDISDVTNWDEVRDLVRESYYLMAPKSLAQQIVGDSKPAAPSKSKRTVKRR